VTARPVDKYSPAVLAVALCLVPVAMVLRYLALAQVWAWHGEPLTGVSIDAWQWLGLGCVVTLLRPWKMPKTEENPNDPVVETVYHFSLIAIVVGFAWVAR
jgi:hypothetical protein